MSRALLHSSASVEWYTPEWVAELARRVMGSIDLDPASCDVAQRTIKALEYYTREDDGLAKPWVGNVFCNPPYGRTVDPDGGATRSSCEVWTRVGSQRASSGSCDQVFWVVPFRPGARWFMRFIGADGVHCYVPRSRVHFGRSDGKPAGAPHHTCFVYQGKRARRFRAACRSAAPGSVLEVKSGCDGLEQLTLLELA